MADTTDITGKVIDPPIRGLKQADGTWTESNAQDTAFMPSRVVKPTTASTLSNRVTVVERKTTDTSAATPFIPTGDRNLVYATPDGTSGAATLRALLPDDLPLATTSNVGASMPDGTSLTVAGGVLSTIVPSGSGNEFYATADGTSGDASLRTIVPTDLPVATSSALGIVKPDATTVNISSGTISAATATSSSPGIVQPDNSTITISGGVISAVGGSSSYPLTFVQEAFWSNFGNSTPVTFTFPKATASSGNTVFLLVATDGSQTIPTPSGWTVDFDQTQPNYCRLTLYHKATAADTSVTFSPSSNTSYGVYLFELNGSRALDQHSTGGTTNANYLVPPSITPTAGSVAFSAVSLILNQGAVPGASPTPLGLCPVMDPAWKALTIASAYSGNGHSLFGYVGQVPATHVLTEPPIFSFPNVNMYPSGGIAYATFSIL